MQIGPINLRNHYALAPMAGLSDVPFRALAWRFGAGYLVSEMVGSQPQLWETGKSRLRRMPVPGVDHVAVQIAGSDPIALADSARRHVGEGAGLIDINFGCPAKKVCRKSAGSALLSDLDLVARIVAQVAGAVDVPVTVKTRTGLAPGDDRGVQAGIAAVRNGAQMVVMHARSRACKFAGEIDYSPVQRLVSEVDVPVLVNGDVETLAGAQLAMASTGAAGVMIGRGAMGQPWLFAALLGKPELNVAAKWAVIVEHVASMHEFYGEYTGVRMARKHVQAYFKRMGPTHLTVQTGQFMALTEPEQQLAWLERASQQAA